MGIEAKVGPPAGVKGSPTEIKIGSAQPTQQLQAAERRQRYAALRERLGKSKLEVKGLAGIHYTWQPINDTAIHAGLSYLGYSRTKTDPLAPKVTAAGMKSDGTFSLGDVELWECPEEIYEFLMLDNEERSNALIYNAAEEFKSQARDSGVPTFDVDKPPRGK